ncbi:hypothetical protein [Heliophilum fasciatum]|nr:hypothetical protein [Heliophilum fasciatum]MCW2279273.1 hypothetical protein [Heliophilum fasciatum]
MLHANGVTFNQDQDAFIVGVLKDKNNDKFVVDVLKVLNGSVKSDTLLLSDNFKYGWGQDQITPSVGDFCVMSIKESSGYYINGLGIFKADYGDYKNLKILSENTDVPGLFADLACIEWYVNSGGLENDFVFSAGTAYIRRPNGDVVQIYPKINNNSITIDSFEPKDRTISEAKHSSRLSDPNFSSVMILLLLVFDGFIDWAFITILEKLTNHTYSKRKKWGLVSIWVFIGVVGEVVFSRFGG